jgi:hypothetical protein
MKWLKTLLLIITFNLDVGHPPTQGAKAFAAAETPSDPLTALKSVQHLKRKLQKNRFDFVSWHKLGVAYYNSGMPAKAIKPLLYSAGKIREASLNSLYLGLSYEATDRLASARYWLQQASVVQDDAGSKALFELASIEFRARNTERSMTLLRAYIQRFPAGSYRQQAEKLLASATTGKFSDPAPGIEKPDMERIYFSTAKRSLIDYPHFWFLQTGFNVVSSTFKDPTDDPQVPLEPREDLEYAIVANAGIGVGPWREGTKTASGGYIYRQNYYTNDTRLTQFFENPGDFRYFPFRFDLLKRRHTLFGDFRGNLTGNIDAGIFGRHEIAKIGSQFFSGIEEGDLRNTLNVSDTTVLIPWVGTSFLPGSRSTAYMYLRKEINAETQDLSNQTFSFFGNKDSVFSLGASHVQSLLSNRLTASGEIFRYEFIFNDYWLDFNRLGVFGEVDYKLNQAFSLNGMAGFYKDEYALPRVRMSGKCNTAARSDSSTGDDSVPALCRRDDDGLVFQAGARWNIAIDSQLSANLLYLSNSNSVMQEYTFDQIKFQIAITRAFPTAQRVERVNERFADYVFFKEMR